MAIDANGRSGRDGGNDGVRAGCGLDCMELFRDEDDASGEEINDFESKDERHRGIAVVAAT